MTIMSVVIVAAKDTVCFLYTYAILPLFTVVVGMLLLFLSFMRSFQLNNALPVTFPRTDARAV